MSILYYCSMSCLCEACLKNDVMLGPASRAAQSVSPTVVVRDGS